MEQRVQVLDLPAANATPTTIERAAPNELGQLRDQIQRLTEQRNQDRERIARNTDHWQWVERIDRIPTAHLSSTDKSVYRDLWAPVRHAQSTGQSGPITIYIGGDYGRAVLVGVSPKTYTSALNNLAQAGCISVHRPRDPITGHTRIEIEPTPQFWKPETLSNPAPRRYAYQPRRECPNCGPDGHVTEREIVSRQYYCHDCNARFEVEPPTVTDRDLWEDNDRLSDSSIPGRQLVALMCIQDIGATSCPSALDEEPKQEYQVNTGVGDSRARITHVTDLQHEPRWVGWKYGPERPNSKRAKEPINPHTGNRAKSNDPTTWGTWTDACRAVGTYGLDGVAFMLGDGFTGVDLDDCIDPITGELNPEARAIVDSLDTYTELSPSGTGVKCFMRGTFTGKRNVGYLNRQKIEMYDHTRHFTFTSQLLAGARLTIEERTDALTALHRSLFPVVLPCNVTPPPPVFTRSRSDSTLLEKAKSAGSGPAFQRLYDVGDLAGHHGDHSAADLALCGMLLYWTNHDPVQADNLFRGSALMRPKWDEVHHGDGRTYGQMTLAKALEGLTRYDMIQGERAS